MSLPTLQPVYIPTRAVVRAAAAHYRDSRILSLPNLQPVYIPTDIVCMTPVYKPYTYMYELVHDLPVPDAVAATICFSYDDFFFASLSPFS